MDKERKSRPNITNLILRIVGGIVLAAGLIMAICGFVDIKTASENGEMPKILLLMIGLPALAIGGMLLMLSFSRTAGSQGGAGAPVCNISPGTTAPTDPLRLTGTICPSCGEVTGVDALFCDKCGKPLCKFCPDCGEANAADARFCKKCGKSFSDDSHDTTKF